MTARSIFEATNANSATPGSAANVRVAAQEANALTAQETINVLGCAPNGGTSLAFGVSAANDTKIRAANTAYQVAKQSAAAAEQNSIMVAKDVLRSTGDVSVC